MLPNQIKVNLSQLPSQEQIKKHPKDTVVTLGNIHGSAIKFMWELIYNGVIKLEGDDYKKALEIYNKNWARFYFTGYVDKKDGKSFMEDFSKILENVKICPNCPKIRLLGNFIADRGNNDVMTLLLLKKIKNLGAQVEIMASNHDLFFLADYDEDLSCLKPKLKYRDHGKYVTGLIDLVKKGIVEQTEIIRLIEDSYLPSFKLLSYALDGKKLTLFMHSLCEFKTIKELAIELEVTYKDSNAQELADTIDEINNSFQVLRYIDNIKFKKMIANTQTKQHLTKPLTKIAHSYIEDNKDKPDELKDLPDYINKVVHGHCGQSYMPKSAKDVCLDNNLEQITWTCVNSTHTDYTAIEPDFKCPNFTPENVFNILNKKQDEMGILNNELEQEINKINEIKHTGILFTYDMDNVNKIKSKIKTNVAVQQQMITIIGNLDINRELTTSIKVINQKLNDIITAIDTKDSELATIPDAIKETKEILDINILNLNLKNIQNQLKQYFSIKNIFIVIGDWLIKRDAFYKARKLHGMLKTEEAKIKKSPDESKAKNIGSIIANKLWMESSVDINNKSSSKDFERKKVKKIIGDIRSLKLGS